MADPIPPSVEHWLETQGFGYVVGSSRVAGGCINNGMRVQTRTGQWFFLKSNPNAPVDMFQREAEGLAALRIPHGPRLPEAYLWGTDFLLLEDLDPAGRAGGYWTALGEQLAALHAHCTERFGFPHDNYIGSTPQPNTWNKDGFAFFAEERLGFQTHLALERGLLSAQEAGLVEAIAGKLPDLVPEQPASLLHGDLWGGNAISDARGQPALIDPAAHYGWAEAELAMTGLFGGFPAEFYSAYEAARPLDKGYRDRFPLYNLYHLLNHLNLFGMGYYPQVKAILERYA